MGRRAKATLAILVPITAILGWGVLVEGWRFGSNTRSNVGTQTRGEYRVHQPLEEVVEAPEVNAAPAPVAEAPTPPPEPTVFADVPTALVNGLATVETGDDDSAIGDHGRSFGRGQLQIATAQYLRRQFPGQLPRLDLDSDGTISNAEARTVLLNRGNNTQFIQASLLHGHNRYGSWRLAVAAHNAGYGAPRRAQIQHLLNEVAGSNLATDGSYGTATRAALSEFQRDQGLVAQATDRRGRTDRGLLYRLTEDRLEQRFRETHPNTPLQRGRMPGNRSTPDYTQRVLNLADMAN